jgi:signal transduction histidine kinase
MTGAGRVTTVTPMPTFADLVERCRGWPTVVADAVLAALVAVVTIVSVLVESDSSGDRITAWGWLLLAAQLVPLVWRRRAPVPVAVVCFVSGMVYGMAVLPDPPVVFALLLATYTVAAERPRGISLPLAAGLMTFALVGIVFGDPTDAADVAVGYFTGIAAWVIGDTTRGQRERAAWLEQRQSDAARDERLRIARDLHDVVAHHVSVIAVQAEAAQAVLATQPERAGAAMGNVADTARAALGELRRVLGVLRSDAVRTPQPGLAALDDLVAAVREAGLPVTVRTVGEARSVDALVGLTAYRVVQEGLTNVLKHAGACSADVELDYRPDQLVVSVVDDGAGLATGVERRGQADGTGSSGVRQAVSASGDGLGQGLAGMRERVAAVGGAFAAGPRDEGGFAVRATLPLHP